MDGQVIGLPGQSWPDCFLVCPTGESVCNKRNMMPQKRQVLAGAVSVEKMVLVRGTSDLYSVFR